MSRPWTEHKAMATLGRAAPQSCLSPAPTCPICESVCLGNCVCVGSVVLLLHDMSACVCLGSLCWPDLLPTCGHTQAGHAISTWVRLPFPERSSSMCISATSVPVLHSLPCTRAQGNSSACIHLSVVLMGADMCRDVPTCTQACLNPLCTHMLGHLTFGFLSACPGTTPT